MKKNKTTNKRLLKKNEPTEGVLNTIVENTPTDEGVLKKNKLINGVLQKTTTDEGVLKKNSITEFLRKNPTEDGVWKKNKLTDSVSNG